MTSTLNKIKDCLNRRKLLNSIFDLNQKSILNAILKNDVVSVIKSRQAGITTVILYYVASLMKFSNDKKSIAYFGFNNSASESFLKQLGFLLRGYCENNLRVNKKDLYLEGSYFKTIQDYYKLTGARFDVIIIDEAAYHKNLDCILMYASQALTIKGKLICISSGDIGGISDSFQNFHFRLNNALEFYKKDLLIEKNDILSARSQVRMSHSVSLRCYKKSSTELKKEKLNIY